MPDTNYDLDHAQAVTDGTALPERTNDLPPADLYHTALALYQAFGDNADGLAEAGVPPDAALWGMLDVTRAAAWLGERDPARLAPIADTHPWLRETVDSPAGAEGAIAGQF